MSRNVDQIDRHHRKCKSRGGDESPRNISYVRHDLHVSFHRIFQNADPHQVARILNDTWIDPDYKLVVVKK